MSDDTIRVRVERGDYRHEREHYTRGEELEVSPKTLEKHPNSLSRVEEPDESEESGGSEQQDVDETSVESTADDVDDVEVDPHPSELTVPELEDRITDVDDLELLKAIRDAEAEDGDPRTTAVDALDDRIEDLEG